MDDGVEGRRRRVARLGQRAGKAVDDVATRAGGCSQRLVHDGDDEFVGDELTAGEQLGELACRCATGVRPVPQELTRRNQRHAEVAGETDALGAFAGTGLTEQSEPHGTGPPPPE